MTNGGSRPQILGANVSCLHGLNSRMLRLLRYHSPTRSATPPGEHVIVFDGTCAFCTTSVEFIRRHSRTNVTLVPFSKLSQYDLLTSLDQKEILSSAHYVTPEGQEYHGGESITRALRLVPGGQAVGLLDLWGIALFRELAYALIAGNRFAFPKVPRWLRLLFNI